MKYKDFNASGIDGPDNYLGEDLSRYDDWLVAGTQSRDSEPMGVSNFETALKRLGGESDDVVVLRFGHWACGWYELILVNPGNADARHCAIDIEKELENYPCLDESDASERERDKYVTQLADDVVAFVEKDVHEIAEDLYDEHWREYQEGDLTSAMIAKFVIREHMQEAYIGACIEELAPESDRAWELVKTWDEIDEKCRRYTAGKPAMAAKTEKWRQDTVTDLQSSLRAILLGQMG